MAVKTQTRTGGWKIKTTSPPKLSSVNWVVLNVVGVVFLLMGILQLVSFSDFKDTLNGFGLSGATAWAVALIIAELWAAACCFKLRLSYGFRMVSALFAILASGFWFFESIQLVSGGSGEFATNNGFFGRFLAQGPGWWTIVEASVFLFLVVYALEASKDSLDLK